MTITTTVRAVLAPLLLAAGVAQECAPAEPEAAPTSVVADLVEDCVEAVPPVEVFDCEAWDPLYACLGATETEVRAMNWLRARESACGERLQNPRTSDIGDCQLNGVHGRPGHHGGRRWPSGWAVERFGLAPSTSLASWRSNTDTPEGRARLAAACLFLVRDADDGALGEPDAFRGCKHWRHPGWRRTFGCGVAA